MNKGKICVAVCAGTADRMITGISRSAEFADIIELRFDCLPEAEIVKMLQKISTADFKAPMLATFRPADQGGNRNLTDKERIKFWSGESKLFWGGDFEEDAIKLARAWKNKIISHHDFSEVPDDLPAIYERLAANDADIIKIAVQADRIT